MEREGLGARDKDEGRGRRDEGQGSETAASDQRVGCVISVVLNTDHSTADG